MKIGQRLTIACAFLCSTASAELLASTDSSSPAKTSFAYSLSHTVKPLPKSVIEKITEPTGEALSADDFDLFEPAPKPKPVDVRVGPPRHPSRDLVCSAAASVAQANNLPVPFFANLIWAESSFDIRTISRAGAQGIAQFMPRTAVQFGLINPFEPIHALNVAGKFVRDLNAQFGNLGLAAAAYNAGPRRVSDWLAKRGELPGETRNYVVRITGRPVEEWVGAKNDVEMLLMPAKAPCVQVAEAVEAQAKAVRTARLIAELAATASQMRDKKDDVQPAAAAVASDTTERGWIVRATVMVRNVLKRLEAREVAARLSAKVAAAKAAKQTRLAANDQDDRPSGRTARNFEARPFTPPPGKAPPSIERDPPRSAVRVIGATDGKDSSRGGPKTDGSKADPDKLEPAKQAAAAHMAKADVAKPDATKPDATKPDATKPDATKPDVAKSDVAKPGDAKPEQKEAATPPRRPRVQRVARFSYSDMLKPQ